ncbi:MAG: hypothetical protein K2R93_21935 [Gemmatimonadaceae bacterium]|nr:hypothetical protein [Gemmatimonadaceae bacterium]
MRIAKQSVLALVIAAVSVATATGCGLVDPEYQYFTVAIDSVTGPDTVIAKSSFTQQLWGPLSSNGCAEVDRIFIRPGETQSQIQLQGRRKIGACENEPAKYLKAYVVTLTAPSTPGPYAVSVLRPGPTLVRTITIK